MLATRETPKQTIEALIEKGEIERCAACGELSAYAWEDVSPEWDRRRAIFCTRQPGLVAHIPTASHGCWECGHCGASNWPLIAGGSDEGTVPCETCPTLETCMTSGSDGICSHGRYLVAQAMADTVRGYGQHHLCRLHSLVKRDSRLYYVQRQRSAAGVDYIDVYVATDAGRIANLTRAVSEVCDIRWDKKRECLRLNVGYNAGQYVRDLLGAVLDAYDDQYGDKTDPAYGTPYELTAEKL